MSVPPTNHPKSNRSHVDDVEIEPIEWRIEAGCVFESVWDTTVPNSGGTAEALFRTGDKAVTIKSRFIVAQSDEFLYQAFSDSTVSATGSAITPIRNRNDNSSNTTTVSFFNGPTITDDGNPYPALYLPGATGQGQRTIGQFSQEGQVRILQPNTDHILRITNDGGTNNARIQVYILWSEYPTDNIYWRN